MYVGGNFLFVQCLDQIANTSQVYCYSLSISLRLEFSIWTGASCMYCAFHFPCHFSGGGVTLTAEHSLKWEGGMVLWSGRGVPRKYKFPATSRFAGFDKPTNLVCGPYIDVRPQIYLSNTLTITILIIGVLP